MVYHAGGEIQPTMLHARSFAEFQSGTDADLRHPGSGNAEDVVAAQVLMHHQSAGQAGLTYTRSSLGRFDGHLCWSSIAVERIR